MSKVLVLYYSSYGHIEAMAAAVAEGAREAGAQVDIKRVPELVSEKVARDSHYKVDQAAPVAKIDDLAAYDAIIVGNAHTPAWVGWLGRLVPGPWGSIEQRDIGKAFVAEIAKKAAETGVVFYNNQGMRKSIADSAES